jgi:hypothetical protein
VILVKNETWTEAFIRADTCRIMSAADGVLRTIKLVLNDELFSSWRMNVLVIDCVEEHARLTR